MFSKIIEAIRNLFRSLFGGGKKSRTQIEKEAITDAPQDAAEVTQDSIVIVANETEPVIIAPENTEEEFDPELFDSETDTLETEEDEVPVIEPEVTTETSVETETEETEETPEPTEPAHEPRYLWCLDNGHGKQTKGKRSPLFDDEETRFFEYEFNRDIVARIIEKLEEKGVKYFNVVPEVDTDNFLKGRVQRANSKKSNLPKIFLSIHSNAASAASSESWAADNISGIETWHYYGSSRGKKLAGLFQKELVAATGFKNRHLKSKKTKQFYVLRKTTMMSVLTENGFYNNKKEAAKLMKDSMRQKIADAHVAAIMQAEEHKV